MFEMPKQASFLDPWLPFREHIILLTMLYHPLFHLDNCDYNYNLPYVPLLIPNVFLKTAKLLLSK